MSDNAEITAYRSVVEAIEFDLANLDLRPLIEENVRRQIREYCARHNRTLLGPILIDWTCRGAVRTSPGPEEHP